ncbi:amidohydrolase [Helicobacter sp. 11S03491-1]|uniref:amidohydrolase n=1 Tax=Helicobacter sp. 11S03491-1 TaxID=1476196 RepID=UPI000BA5D4C1|nr:amidohydrolase [Helicobacter sp. 11S03491-1]
MQYFKNGKIFKEEGKFYEAMGIEDGKISWLGKNETIKDKNAIDLEHAIVIPTFIDSHTHPDMVAKNIDSIPCLPPEINSIEEIIDALKQSPYHNGDSNQWIDGFGWDENVLKEKRAPTCCDLDKVSTIQPIMIYHSSYHIIACNTKALEIAHINKQTKDPKKGKIGRFENGEPNGIFYEPEALDLIRNKRKPTSFEETVEQILKLGKKYNQLGISVVSDMFSLYEPVDRIKIYEEAKKRGFRQKVALYYEWNSVKRNGKKPITKKTGDIYVAGIKLFIDGSIAGRTAFMKENYPNDNQRGMKLMDEDELMEALEYARDNELQIAIHVMGDGAIKFLVDTLKDIQPWIKNAPTIRLEHASIMSVSQLEDIKKAKMSFALAPQPIFLFAEYEAYEHNLTPDLLKIAYSMKTDDAYVLTTLSSDAPATLWANPENLYVTLQASTNRISANHKDMNKTEALNVCQAIRMLSINGAKILGLENIGKLDIGYEASFQILNDDIFTMPANQLANVLPKEVYLHGNKI